MGSTKVPKLGFSALPGRQPQDPAQTAVVRSCQMVEVAQVAPLPAREEMLVLRGGSSAGEGARADLPAPSRGHDSLVGLQRDERMAWPSWRVPAPLLYPLHSGPRLPEACGPCPFVQSLFEASSSQAPLSTCWKEGEHFPTERGSWRHPAPMAELHSSHCIRNCTEAVQTADEQCCSAGAPVNEARPWVTRWSDARCSRVGATA